MQYKALLWLRVCTFGLGAQSANIWIRDWNVRNAIIEVQGKWWLGPLCHSCLQKTGWPHRHQAWTILQHDTEFHQMQDWILTHTIRNHVPAWTEIVIPCPCQGHQPRGTPPGPHPPGGAPVLTDPTIFIHLIYAITLTNTYFTHHLCYRRYVNYCIHYIPLFKS